MLHRGFLRDASARASTGDVVDMEAFALARVCLAENARFACVKYITDGADSDSATHWEAALDNGRARLRRVLLSLSIP